MHNTHTRIHPCSPTAKNKEIVELLLAHCADIEARTTSGSTPLHTAVSFLGNMEVVEALLARKADVNGFYEWQQRGSIKQPVHIVLKNREAFGFAGLWDTWTSPEGEEIRSCTIITTESNELLKPVHDRMPVILSPEAEDVWLDPSIQDPLKLLPLLRPYPGDEMEFYQVSRRVNSPENDTADCVVEVE